MMLKLGLNSLYPTPVYIGEIDSDTVNQLVSSALLNEDLNAPSSDFQSFDILNDGPEEFRNFKDNVIYPEFERYLDQLGYDIQNFPDARLRSWITGVRNGYMIPAHNHSGASFSGVFYLFSELKENDGGDLVLLDPRNNANRGYKDQFKPMFENTYFRPKSGQFIIFPSYLYHHTTPYTGKMRLAMPVDLFL